MFLRCASCDYRIPEWEMIDGHCSECYEQVRLDYSDMQDDHLAGVGGITQQAGIGMGINAYNDAQGCSVEFDDPENTPT